MPQPQDNNTSPFNLPGREESTESKGSWAVPWSDLMLVMFILFLVLFAFHAKEELVRVPVTPAQPWSNTGQQQNSHLNLESLYGKAQEKLDNPGAPIRVEMSQQGNLLISLFGKTFFEPGNTELNPNAHEYLGQIGEIVSLAQGEVMVTGYAASGEEALKSRQGLLEVSALRAARIGQTLADTSQLRKDKLIIQGHGSSMPQVPRNTPGGEELNRRVEIRIGSSG